MLLFQYEDVLAALAILSNISIRTLILMQQDRDQAQPELVLMRRLLAEIAYYNVVAPKIRAIAMEPDHFRRETYVFYNSMRLGWQVGQSFEFCMVTGIDSERRDAGDAHPIPDYFHPGLRPSEVQMFHIVPPSLDGEELSYLFGVDSRLLADLRNGKCP